MIELKITWHFLLLIIALVIGLIKVFTLDDRNDALIGSHRFWGGVIYIIISAFVIVIYGGIFWW
jgi:hypothetical protein